MTTETETAAEPMSDRRAMFLLLRDLKQLEAEQADANAWIDAVREQYSAESAERAARQFEIREAVERFAADLRVPGTEHVDVPGIARLQFTTRKESLRVADAAEALKYCGEYEHREFVRIKEELDVTPFKAFADRVLREDGEMLPGVEIVPESTSLSIRWREAGK